MFSNFVFSIIFDVEIEMYFGALNWFVMVLIYNLLNGGGFGMVFHGFQGFIKKFWSHYNSTWFFIQLFQYISHNVISIFSTKDFAKKKDLLS